MCCISIKISPSNTFCKEPLMLVTYHQNSHAVFCGDRIEWFKYDEIRASRLLVGSEYRQCRLLSFPRRCSSQSCLIVLPDISCRRSWEATAEMNVHSCFLCGRFLPSLKRKIKDLSSYKHHWHLIIVIRPRLFCTNPLKELSSRRSLPVTS